MREHICNNVREEEERLSESYNFDGGFERVVVVVVVVWDESEGLMAAVPENGVKESEGEEVLGWENEGEN